ncbi:hypothetical protein [Aeoliella sp. SH292]|uniref:hypothetical protein n=1 Tax=Aeoliella sp. SH292 TaxID=3454464 RepID=UPI003F9E896B
MNRKSFCRLGEQLDAHRKRQQQLHPKLTMTGMYNVLEKLRSEEALSAKEREIHEWGLVSVLRQIHDDLDAAVAEAYGWPVDLTGEEILERLVALNHERAEEEKRGIIRWLRPEYQNPEGVTQRGITTTDDDIADDGDDDKPTKGRDKAKSKAKSKATEKIKKQKWPTALSEQAAAVASTLTTIASPADDADVAKHFTRANRERIAELLETLESLGKVRQLPTGKYVAI